MISATMMLGVRIPRSLRTYVTREALEILVVPAVAPIALQHHTSSRPPEVPAMEGTPTRLAAT
jgi:hypothetical protein